LFPDLKVNVFVRPYLVPNSSLSLQGAVTRCEVDAVPMFVLFRKKKVLYQVWYGYVFRNGNWHVAVTCRMIIPIHISIILGLICAS